MTSTLPLHHLAPIPEGVIREAIIEGRIMDSEQAADWLRVDRITVRTLIAKKRLRPIRKGMRPLLFLEEDVFACEDIRAGRE